MAATSVMAAAAAVAPTSEASSDQGADPYADDTFEAFDEEDDYEGSLNPSRHYQGGDPLCEQYPQAAWGNTTAEAFASEELGEEEQLLRCEVEQRIRILNSVSSISR